jgi:hypothetical protein
MSLKSIAAAAASLVSLVSASGQYPWQSPVYNHIFEFPLPFPVEKQVLK